MFLAALLFSTSALASPPPPSDAFAPLRFLVGDWVNIEGGGEPGKASAGELSFRFEIEGKALVRRSFTDFPAQEGRPALHHEDLTVVFPENGTLKALYLDNEGHVIHYVVSALPGSSGAVFLSEPTGTGPGPQQRLTYRSEGQDTLIVTFDLAEPGKDFVTHVGARMKRKK